MDDTLTIEQVLAQHSTVLAGFYKAESKLAAAANRMNQKRVAVNTGNTVFYKTISGVTVDRNTPQWNPVNTVIETIDFDPATY